MARRRDPGRTTRYAPRSVRIAVSLVLSWTLAAGILIPASHPAAGAGIPLTLYVDALGWSTTPGGPLNPPLVYRNGDLINITLTSEDGLPHGLLIDYPNDPDYQSPITDATIQFDFVPDVTGVFNYCDQIVITNCGEWETKPPNRAPTAAMQAPTTGTSWTAGVPHQITFDVSDPDGDAVEVTVNYTYNQGTVQGLIRDWEPAPPGVNTVPWTPDFHAEDTIVYVSARDPSGAFGTFGSVPFKVDSQAPVIDSVAPARGAVQVDRGTSVAVTWSEPMNPASGNPDAFGVQLAGGGPLVSGTVTWSADGRTMTFQPAAALSPGSTYEVHVSATARDASDPGNEFASPDVWTFSVATADVPRITSVAADPPRQAPGGSVNLTVDVQGEVEIATVSADIMGPSFHENLTMTHLTGPRWYLNRAYTTEGHYDVVIWAIDASGKAVSRPTSIEISRVGTGSLPAPASVAATFADGAVEVTWSPIPGSGLAGYHVYRGDASTGPFTKLTPTPLPASGPTVYHDRNAAPGRTYFYAVTAVDSDGGESEYGRASAVTTTAYQKSPILDPVPWALAIATLCVILGAVYGTAWRRRGH